MSSARFRIAVGAVVENSNEEILLIKRSDYGKFAGIWDVVGGGKNQYEDPFNTLSREMREEVGITNYEVIKLIYIYTSFKEEATNQEADLIGFIFWCKTKETNVSLSFEHTEYVWLKPGEALKIASHKDIIGSIQSLIKEKQKICKN